MAIVKSDDFMLAQYNALREEILAIKTRIIKLQLSGITVIPLIIGAGQKIPVVMLAAPLITIAFIFMVIFEQNSLMRAGTYIRILKKY